VVDSGITQGGGIQVGQRFNSTPVGPDHDLRQPMIRDGSLEPELAVRRRCAGFDGSQGAITGPINVTTR